MFKFMCLLALYMASVNSLCVRESRETVLCRNEFMFRQLFRTATTVDLIDSFMAARNVQMFPRLKIVRVAGLYAAETCKSLSSTDIKLYGCEAFTTTDQVPTPTQPSSDPSATKVTAGPHRDKLTSLATTVLITSSTVTSVATTRLSTPAAATRYVTSQADTDSSEGDDDYDDVIAGTVTPTSVIIIVIVAILVRRYIIRRRTARRYRSLMRNRFHLQRVHNELVEEQQQNIDVPPPAVQPPDDQTSVKQRSYESVQLHAHPTATPRSEPKYANVAPRAPVQGGACAYPDAVANEHAVFGTPERRDGAWVESNEHIYEAYDFKTPCAPTPPSRQRACANAATMTSPITLDISSKSLPSETDALTATHDSNDSTMTIDLSGDCGEPAQPEETRL